MSQLWSFELLSAAADDLAGLDQLVRASVLNRLDWLTANFEVAEHERLGASLKDYYKLRVGDYRVVYLFHYLTKTITVIRIGRRDKVYKLKL